MYKRSPDAEACNQYNAFVPFSWEEKPGVPKTQESNHLVEQQQQLQLVSIHIPAALPAALLSCPLRTPPRLQQQHNYSGPLVCRTPSFDTLYAARHISSAAHDHHSKLLVRRPSFDAVIYGGRGRKPLTGKNSHHGRSLSMQQSRPSCRSRTQMVRKEDDPFFMAIQACGKEPIRVFYHHDKSSKVCEEEMPRKGRSAGDLIESGENFKHLTIRKLLMQQLQEEAQYLQKAQKEVQEKAQYLQLKAQEQPLIVKKKHGNGLFAFLARCLGCYWS